MAPQFHICVGLGFISMDLGPADLKSTVEFVGEPTRCWLGLLVVGELPRHGMRYFTGD